MLLTGGASGMASSTSAPVARTAEATNSKRSFHLGAIRAVGPEFRRVEQRGQHFADVALLVLESLRHAIDQRRRRIVGHKALREFQRNEMRGLRTGGQHVQHFPALVFAFGLDAMSEHKLRAGLVHARLVLETAAFVGLVDGPAGKDFGDFGDVALRVAAVHAERVQFQQLAAVVLVEAAVLLRFAFGFGRRKRRGRPYGP